jgi:hypothetical protein
MKEIEVIKVVEMMIGHTDFYGESNHDEVSLKNLDNLYEIVDACLCTLYNHVNYHRDDYRASGKALAKKSYELMKSFKVYVANTIELYEEVNNDK